jgi:hypothetical protein
MRKRDRKKQRDADAGRRRFEPVSDDLVLAAVDRAERHRWGSRSKDAGVAWGEIVAHLGFVHVGWTTRQLRPQVDALVAMGLLSTDRRHGRTYWTPTAITRRRLASLRRVGRAPYLPESPQHRIWRLARTSAAEHIDRFRIELGHELDKGTTLVARPRQTHSDAWFDLGDRVSDVCRLLGSATHCLYEWSEPDDATADVDERNDPGDERLGDAVRERMRRLRSGRRWWRTYSDEDDAPGSPPAEIVTVPAEIVDDLRVGLHNELGVPAEGILEVVGRTDRERRVEKYHEHLECLNEVCALLDLIGWAPPTQRTAVTIDLGSHRRAVLAALDFAVRTSTNELSDAATTDASSETTVKRVSVLREFAASVKS